MEIKDKKGSENIVSDHLSRLERNEKDEVQVAINKAFPDKQLLVVQDLMAPWFADFVNFLASEVMSMEMNFH